MKLLKRLLAGMLVWTMLFSPLSAHVAMGQDSGPANNDVRIERVTFKDDIIYFAFDSDVVSCEGNQVIEGVIEKMARYPSLVLTLEGNASYEGDVLYNINLSKRRTVNTLKCFTDRGVERDRFVMSWLGATNPGSTKNPDASKEKDRSVKFHIRDAEMVFTTRIQQGDAGDQINLFLLDVNQEFNFNSNGLNLRRWNLKERTIFGVGTALVVGAVSAALRFTTDIHGQTDSETNRWKAVVQLDRSEAFVFAGGAVAGGFLGFGVSGKFWKAEDGRSVIQFNNPMQMAGGER